MKIDSLTAILLILLFITVGIAFSQISDSSKFNKHLIIGTEIFFILLGLFLYVTFAFALLFSPKDRDNSSLTY